MKKPSYICVTCGHQQAPGRVIAKLWRVFLYMLLVTFVMGFMSSNSMIFKIVGVATFFYTMLLFLFTLLWFLLVFSCCNKCGNRNLIPSDSPVGREMIEHLHHSSETTSTSNQKLNEPVADNEMMV